MPNPNALAPNISTGATVDPAAVWAMLMAQMRAARAQQVPLNAEAASAAYVSGGGGPGVWPSGPTAQSDLYRYGPRASTTSGRRAQDADALEGIDLGPAHEEATDAEKRAAYLAYDKAVQALSALDTQIAEARASDADPATLWALQTQRATFQQQAAAASRVDTDPQEGIAQVWARLNPNMEEVAASGMSPTQFAMQQQELAERMGMDGVPTKGAEATGATSAYTDDFLNTLQEAGREDLIGPYLENAVGLTKTTAFDKMGQMLNLAAMQEDIASSRAARKRAAEAAERAAAQQAFANLMARSQLQHDALQYAQAYGLPSSAEYVPGFEPGGMFATMAQRGGYGFTPLEPLNLPQPAGLANPAPQWAYQAMNRGM